MDTRTAPARQSGTHLLMRRGHGAVIVTDAQGRQVFGLTAEMSRELERRGAPAQFQGFTVRVNADPPPGWWIDLPGYVVLAGIRNRGRELRAYIRHRLYLRAYRRMRASLSDAETTSPDTSTSEDD